MKVQYLAVIFVVIMIPIAVVFSRYVQTQIDTISNQTSYSSKLYDATYDAVTAFQINTVNNRYSSVSNSKIRDIEASANTFFTSLTDNMSSEGYSQEALQPYVPALVYTLYDGYYIYGRYKNVMPNEGQVQNPDDSDYQWGLKSYIYYSCRYIEGTKEAIINYTLDNFITVYYKNGSNYETRSGYLINPTAWNSGSSTYEGIEILDEPLREYVLFKTTDAAGNYESGTYEYIVYQSQKIYKESDPNLIASNGKYFRYDDYQKSYINPGTQTERDIDNYIAAGSDQGAHAYFDEAQDFSNWVLTNLNWVSQSDAVDESGNPLTMEYWQDLDISTENFNDPIFDTTSADNNPFSSSSVFDEMRRGAIKRTVQTTLTAAIGAYNAYSGVTYEFALPVLNAEDWDKIQNHVCVMAFMQGLPIGSKYYNNYVILTNDENEEFVSKNAIYITTREGTDGYEYHQPGCKRLIENSASTDFEIINEGDIREGFFNVEFRRQTVRLSEGNYIYFYPQAKDGYTCTACYDCIVDSGGVYSVEDIIDGTINSYSIMDASGNPEVITTADTNSKFAKIRSLYYSALARERYNLYKSNDALNMN